MSSWGFFLRGGGVRGLDGDESDHQTRHVPPDQAKAKLDSRFQPVEGSRFAYL